MNLADLSCRSPSLLGLLHIVQFEDSKTKRKGNFAITAEGKKVLDLVAAHMTEEHLKKLEKLDATEPDWELCDAFRECGLERFPGGMPVPKCHPDPDVRKAWWHATCLLVKGLDGKANAQQISDAVAAFNHAIAAAHAQ